MSSVAGRNVYDADQEDALEKLIISAGADGTKPFIKFRFFPRNSSQNPPPEVRFALNDPPRSIEIKVNEKDELYLAYMCEPNAVFRTGAPPATDTRPPQRPRPPVRAAASQVQDGRRYPQHHGPRGGSVAARQVGHPVPAGTGAAAPGAVSVEPRAGAAAVAGLLHTRSTMAASSCALTSTAAGAIRTRNGARQFVSRCVYRLLQSRAYQGNGQP